jgi:hypothetical protein
MRSCDRGHKVDFAFRELQNEGLSLICKDKPLRRKFHVAKGKKNQNCDPPLSRKLKSYILRSLVHTFTWWCKYTRSRPPATSISHWVSCAVQLRRLVAERRVSMVRLVFFGFVLGAFKLVSFLVLWLDLKLVRRFWWWLFVFLRLSWL